MNWSVAKIGTIYQKPAQAIGLSTPPIGCVLDLPGLPGAGNKIYDRSPYGNHGTITGAVWKRLPSGLWVLNFDGSDDRVDCGDDPSLSPGLGDWSISVWVRTTVDDNYKVIAGGGAWNVTGPMYGMALMAAGTGTLVVVCGVNVTFCPVLGVNDDKWHHIVGQADRDALAYLYVDGAEAATADVSGQSAVDISGAVMNFRLGYMSAAGYYPGYIALPRVYFRLLSALEIQNHYQREKYLFGVC